MSKKPLISCLCVTRNKSHLLPRAISCFKNQSYSNKELIIVYEDDDIATKLLLNDINEPNIKKFEVGTSSKKSLGALRNYSIEVSSGEYFCQWDDDDWYHNARLEMQMDAIEKHHKPASILIYWLIYDTVSQTGYLSFPRAWEGSILCKKSLYPDNRYTDMKMGEDVGFVQGLIAKNLVYPIINASLYIYTFHGNNTWDLNHFQGIFAVSEKLSEQTGKMIGQILQGEIPHDTASNYLFSAQALQEFNYLERVNAAVETMQKYFAAERAKAQSAIGAEAVVQK